MQPFWGSWTLDEPLGEGSYGKVYRIRREDLGVVQYAALKWIALPFNAGEIDHLRSEGMTDPEIHTYYNAQAQELGKEIELMSRVKGTGYIVSYEDHLLQPRSGEVGWDILIRMELLTPLPKYLQEERTIRDVVKLGLDICSALMLCRQHRIIHRDIKLDNIFISGNGDFKLGDFGVARQMERTQGYFSRKGTNYYMAPEVYHGKAYDATVDIYSLGLVLYRLLNRQRLPFTSSTARILSPQDRDEAFARRIGGEPLPPPLLGGPKLQKAVLTACAYDPKKRYRTPEAFRSALEEAATGSNLSAPLAILSGGPPSGPSSGNRDARSRSGNRSGNRSGGRSGGRSASRSASRAESPVRKRRLWPWLTGGIALLAVAAGLFLWRWPGSPLAGPAATSGMPQIAAAPTPTAPPAPRVTPAPPTPDPTPAPTPEQATTPGVVVLGGAELPVSTEAATAVPTPAPTQPPTPAPTAGPTARPTGAPTSAPTDTPTDTPAASSVYAFQDPGVEELARALLDKGPEEPITLEEWSGLESTSGSLAWGAVTFPHPKMYSITISSLEDFRHCTGMKHFWISEQHLQDLSPLADMTSLETLTIDNCTVASLEPLAGMQSLRDITIVATPLSSLPDLSGLPNLSTLDLTECGIVDVAPLSNLGGSLRKLNLTGNRIADTSPLLPLKEAGVSIVLNGNPTTAVEAAGGTPAPAEVILGSGQDTPTVIDYAPVYIEASPESITLSLTVENLAETMASGGAGGSDAELSYGIEFYDGQNVYVISSSRFDADDDMLRDMESTLVWLQENRKGYTPFGQLPLGSIEGDTITWVIPLPVPIGEGPADIAYDAITHFGYFIEEGDTLFEASFEITADGILPLGEDDLASLLPGDAAASSSTPAPTHTPTPEAASATHGSGRVIDHPPVYIDAQPDAITFSLTVENLPETFPMNQKDTMESALEYGYTIAFFDGTNAFEIGVTHFAFSYSEEITGTLWDMQSGLWQREPDDTSVFVTDCPIESIEGNTITWVLPLPVRSDWSGTLDIAYDSITHFGYSIYSQQKDTSHYFEIAGDGSVQEVNLQHLGGLLPDATPAPDASSAPASNALTPYTFQDATVERMARVLLEKKQGETIYLEEWSNITRMMFENEAFSSRYYDEFYQAEIKTLEDFRHCTKLMDLTLSNQNLPDLSPLADMESLETLIFDGCTLGSLSPLASLSRLRVLGFQFMQLESLEPVSELHSLVSLVASSCEISDISPLYGLELFSLFLEDNNIQDVSPLRDMTTLQILDLSRNQITDTSPLLALQEAGATITLEGNPTTVVREQQGADAYTFRDPAVGVLARAMLGKRGTADVTVDEWRSIQHFPGTPAFLAEDSNASLKLHKAIRENPVYSLEDFLLCGNLESLYLADAAVTDLSPLAQVSTLQTLTLIGTRVVDFSPLSELPALTTLYAGYREYLGIDVATLPTGLTSLSLYHCGASDISFLEGFDKLRHLELTGFRIEQPYSAALSGLTQLESLALIACDVRVLPFLRWMPQLQTLDLSQNGNLSDLSALSQLSGLRSLNLSGDGLADIASLQTLSGLKHLDLRDNAIAETSPLYLLSKSGAEILLEGNPAEKVEAPAGEMEFSPASPYYLVTKKTELLKDAVEDSESYWVEVPKGALLSATRVLADGKNLWLQIDFELDYLLPGVKSGYVRLADTAPYDLDAEYTWSEYKKIVEAAANAWNGAHALTMPSPRLVTGHPSKKEMLTIPTWMPLTIEGGHFEGMALNAGTFILKDVTIRSTHDDSPAICLPRSTNDNAYLSGRYTAFGLTLDADCVIEATGENSPAIDIGSTHIYLMQCSISNAGTLLSEKSEGMRLHVNEAPVGATFSITNTGVLQSGADGISCRITGEAEDFRFILDNEGSIRSAGAGVEMYCALQNQGKTFPVINIRNDGEITASNSNGVFLSSNRPGYNFGGYEGNVENGGTIQSGGGYAPILLDTSFEHPAKLSLQNTGTLSHSGDSDLTVEFWSTANAETLSGANHEAERDHLRQWLEQAGFFQLEQPAAAEAIVTYATPPADPKMHESGPGTHFSFRSDE